jgi:GTP-binding protein
VIDTGGWVTNSSDTFEQEIKRQVQLAINEADVILFLVDVQCGITDLDFEVGQLLKRTNKPVILVTNKSDTFEWQYQAAEFYKLGMGDPFLVSSINGLGTGDLLDKLVSYLKPKEDEETEDNLPRFAIVGRPNAGKSSLVNSFLDEERNIVTEIPGTTRDSIYTRFNKFGFDFYLVDTAGIRKKAKVDEDLEY